MKALFLTILFPLLVLNFMLWWDKYEPYYRQHYPERAIRQAFIDMWRD